MTGLPRVRADVLPTAPDALDPTRSTAVELCLFRLCDYTSADVRASTAEDRDEAYRAHLRREHLDDLARLAGVMGTPAEARAVLGLATPEDP